MTSKFDTSAIKRLELRAGFYLDLRKDSITLSDGVLEYETYGEGSVEPLKYTAPVDAQSRAVIEQLVAAANISEWKREYDPWSRGIAVYDGWYWRLLIAFEDGKTFKSEGDNDCPDTLGLLWDGLVGLTGADVEQSFSDKFTGCEGAESWEL